MASDKEMTLGEFLRQERERRGITIEQVASATKVGVKTLHALEADHYSELPAKPFIRGFVTSYCRFLGSDAKEILTRYEDFIHIKAGERPNREAGHSGYAFEKKDGEQQSRMVLMIAIVGFIALGGIAMLILKPSLRHRHNSHLERLRAANGDGVPQKAPAASGGAIDNSSSKPTVSPAPEAALATASPVALPVPTPSPVLTPVTQVSGVPSQSAGSNPLDPLDSGLSLKPEEIKHKAAIKVLADVWVRFQVDERPMRKFVVRKGKFLILRAKEGIRFQVSNPRSIKVSYNGQAYEKMSQIKDSLEERQGNASLFFPEDASEKGQNFFDQQSPLEKTPDPEPDSEQNKINQVSSPASSPTP